MPRKKAITIAEAMMEYIRQAKLASGLNTRCIFKAWDEASGASSYTLKRFFRDGKLYVTLSSSVVRSQLSIQNRLLVEKINGILKENELFTPGENHTVKELILK